MANLKEIRARINAIKSIQQVTKAMKMVAAAKLRKAQDRMLQLRPYSAKLKEIISNVVSGVNPEEIPSKLVEVREVKQVLIIVVTANRGLCGPFNGNIIRHAQVFAEQTYPDLLRDRKVSFLCMGRKGHEYFKKRKYVTVGENADVLTNLTFEGVEHYVEQVFAGFESGEYDRVHVVYNKFRNVMAQDRTVEQLLPLAVSDLAQGQKARGEYIFEPDKESILTDLIPKALKTQVFQAVLESNAAEQGARMVAMDTATENANELLRQLKLTYNKARQASITKEILEISAGANALAAS
jgi:F-type H+-transporting ATPase subunit gamma